MARRVDGAASWRARRRITSTAQGVSPVHAIADYTPPEVRARWTAPTNASHGDMGLDPWGAESDVTDRNGALVDSAPAMGHAHSSGHDQSLGGSRGTVTPIIRHHDEVDTVSRMDGLTVTAPPLIARGINGRAENNPDPERQPLKGHHESTGQGWTNRRRGVRHNELRVPGEDQNIGTSPDYAQQTPVGVGTYPSVASLHWTRGHSAATPSQRQTPTAPIISAPEDAPLYDDFSAWEQW